MKKNLFWIVIIVIIIIGLAVLIVYLILKDEANGVIAAFTIVLAAATIWNIKITWVLLKQSEETSRQAKRAFESNIFREIVSSATHLNAELRISKFPGDRGAYIENFAAGMLMSLKNIDPCTFEKISEEIETWNKIDERFPATTFLKALNMVKKGISVE